MFGYSTMAEAQDRLEVTNTQLFVYQREVVVELHGRTGSGEFDVVSYTFTPDPDEAARVHPSVTIESTHEDTVRDTLDEAGYTLD